MEVPDADFLLFSDQNSELFVNTVEVSTSDAQETESILNLDTTSPQKFVHTSTSPYVKRRTKYDQINVVKVQNQVVSTKISSEFDNSICSILTASGKPNVLHSTPQATSKGMDSLKINVQTTRTVPNILRNTVPKDNSSYNNTILATDKCLKVDTKCVKATVHKRKQVYNSSTIRQESPDWLSDTFNQDSGKNSPDLIQKSVRKINSENNTNKYKRRFDIKNMKIQKNCFLPVVNDDSSNAMNDIDLFGDYIFTENVTDNSFDDLFNFSHETAIDNTHIEFGDSNYLEYSDDIVGSEKLDTLLECSIDNCILFDTCDLNGNDIDTSQTISCTSNQCDKYEDNVDEVSWPQTEIFDNSVEDSQLNYTTKLNQTDMDDCVTFNINDIENECLIDSAYMEYSLIENICDKYPQTSLDLTDINEIREVSTSGNEHEINDINMLNLDKSNSKDNIKNCDKKELCIFDEIFLQNNEDVSENIISPRTSEFCDNSKSDKNFVNRKRTKNISDKKKVRNTAKFQCPLCSLCFRTQRAMAIHRAGAHGGIYMILCEHCGRLFNNKYHLNRHTINCKFSHRPFKCDECDKHYRHKSSLVQHLRNAHDISYTCNTAKQYRCGKCSKVYSKYGSFEKHMSLHDEIDEYGLNE